jgi:predicted Zn-ribbon and HTH transcriptional regulator
MKTCTNKNCGYQWKPKKKEPKACPKCRQYLKS